MLLGVNFQGFIGRLFEKRVKAESVMKFLSSDDNLRAVGRYGGGKCLIHRDERLGTWWRPSQPQVPSFL